MPSRQFVLRPRRREVEQQQRAFGQQRLAASRAQVVEHWQQYQCYVASAAEQAVNVDWQLHHRAGECLEAVLAANFGANPGEVLADLLHLLNEKRGAVGLGHPQRAPGLVQEFAGAHQRRRAAAPVDTVLERKLGVANRFHEFHGNDGERAHRALGAVVPDHLLM